MIEWIKIRKMGESEPVNIFSYIFLHGYEIRKISRSKPEEQTNLATPGLQEEEARGENQGLERESPAWRVVRQTADVAREDSWRWLRNGFLKKETEGLILAAQEQALRTNSIKHSIDKTSETPLCRLCRDCSETVRHIVSGCKKLAQRECRKRHDKVALRVHCEICRK